jgi:hypothetical protein
VVSLAQTNGFSGYLDEMIEKNAGYLQKKARLAFR